tara:strand:+ start:280 stop:510 length:231 start_codon:yes stop_codon:yes gene_type:complete
MHQAVNIIPIHPKVSLIYARIIVTMMKIAIKGQPARLIGVKIGFSKLLFLCTKLFTLKTYEFFYYKVYKSVFLNNK